MSSESFLTLSDDVYDKNEYMDTKCEYSSNGELFSDDDSSGLFSDDDDSSNQKEINPKKLIELYIQFDKDNSCGRLLRSNGIYVECGKQMFQMFKKDKDKDHEKYKQVTIRDIKLDRLFRKKGLLTSFVEYLLSLDDIEAVQLESVYTKWFKERLTESSHWYKQGISENYVRFKEKENNEKFSLF